MAYVYSFDNWTDMGENGTFGNQQILLATANLCNVDIICHINPLHRWKPRIIIKYRVSSGIAFH